MYRVTTHLLGPDARRVALGSENTPRGEVTAEELVQLLENFTQVDPVDNEEHDPNITVAGKSAKLIIRTVRGKLQVYDGRDHAAPAIEMEAPKILEWLDRTTEAPAAAENEQADLPAPTAPHRGIAFAMLLVGLALNGYILYSVFYVESVNKKPEVKLITDADELRNRQTALVGTFTTGSKTGDRVIEIAATGSIRFYEIGLKGPINEVKDTFVLGRHDGLVCLSTVDSGVVDVVGENLVYYKDIYLRKKPSG
jgi:hypothetical protein